MLFQIGIDMHANLCFTKTRSAERLTQLAIHKCLPRSSHRSAFFFKPGYKNASCYPSQN